ncbi:hypothetical protein EVAR_21270_1 [Eumeta japonica]|uniref:Uncharacterized protein n=1 Tax=Eumeta variegata TaxID=151549 RepID=A0A4C1WP91_EUMVA|nr:hypothetical protein EVAR_21270_1 [Eumeta japonica]
MHHSHHFIGGASVAHNALAPLAPETPISGRAVTTAAFKAYHWSSHQGTISTTLQDTEQPSLQLTPARRSSKWDAAERHQSSRRPPHEPGCQDPEVIGEALTRAPVCRPEGTLSKWPAAAAQSADQEVVRREALGLGRFDVHLRQRSGVDNVLGF